MGKLGPTLALLFLSSAALSWASDLVASSGDPSYAYAVRTEPIPLISLPSESEDTAASKLPEAKPAIVESNEEVTTVTFRPADLRLDGQPRIPVSFRFPFRHGRPCHHGRRPFKLRSELPVPARLYEIPYGNDGIQANEVHGSDKEDSLDLPVPEHLEEIPYGNDMIQANEVPRSDKEDSLDPTQWPRFHHHHHRHHHHEEHESEDEKGRALEMIWHGDGDHDMDRGMKKFHHGHRHFEREDDDEREEHKHHHHGRHHHHDDDDDEDEKPGLLMKFRKFLMDRF